MQLDLPNPKTLMQWLPTPNTLETGEISTLWHLDLESRYGAEHKLPIDLNYREVMVRLHRSSETRCSVECRIPSKLHWKDLYGSGYRAVLALDHYLGRLMAINSVKRSECFFLIVTLYVLPDGPQRYDMTELMKAAESNDVGRLKELLAAGSDINAADLVGTTALSWAAHSGAKDAFMRLLDQGADPRTLCADGRTLLHSAALGGDTGIVSELISLKLDLNAVTASGNTPLAFAVIKRKAEAATALLRAGANPRAERGIDICYETRLRFGADHPVAVSICGAADPSS